MYVRKVIMRGINKKTLDVYDSLAEKGALEIISDEHDPHEIAIVIDGTAYGSEAFLEILKNSEGFRMIYKLEESMHNVDGIWYTSTEHMPTGLL